MQMASRALALPSRPKFDELALPRDGSQDPVLTYLAGLSTEKSRTTALESIQRIGRAAKVDWEKIPWGRLTAKETTAIRMRLLKKHAPVTVRLTLSVFRGVLRAAFRLGHLTAEQLARAIDWPKLRAVRIPRGRALTPDEIAHLRQHCGTFPAPYGTFLLAVSAVLLGGGVRREEVAKLLVDAYSSKSLRVLGKGQKERLLPLPKWAAQDIEAWLKVRSTLRVSVQTMFVRLDRTGRIYDRPLSPWMVWNLVVTTTEDAGIDEISTHDFRRTYGSELLDKTDIVTVQHLMGHASPNTTAGYDRRGQRAAEKAVQGLEDWGKVEEK